MIALDILEPVSQEAVISVRRSLETKSNGAIDASIANFLAIMMQDPCYHGIRFNLLSNHAEIGVRLKNGEFSIRQWRDADEAWSRAYIESVYHVHSESKHLAALRLLFRSREYNPIVQIVDDLKWDGEPHCELFLHRWGKVEDSDYSREVSRLIFAGGIQRLYNPGAKFEDVPVLTGDQGSGKSTLIRFLAIHDDYFTDEIRDMSGSKESIEALFGKWICEISELSAFRRTDNESMKAFLSRKVDSYRTPYDRQVTNLPRRCIFIGSSNRRDFLTDLSGNRRWYPVEVHSNGYDIFAQEEEIRADVLQCWAEAREKFKTGTFPPYADRALLTQYRQAQEDALESDWRPGVIEKYLSVKPHGYLVCIKEIWSDCLSPDSPALPKRSDQTDISQIMDRMPGWKKVGRQQTERYGRQRCWQKIVADDSPDDLPF